MVDFQTEQQIRAAVAMRANDFESWVTPEPGNDSFAELPWLDIVTMASVALLTIDKHIKAADGIVDKLSRLYKWMVKKEPQAKPAIVTLPERIIVLLADDLARSDGGLSADTLAGQTLSATDDVKRELDRLRDLSIAVENGKLWRLKVATF